MSSSGGDQEGYYPGATALVFLVLLLVIGFGILLYACSRRNKLIKTSLSDQQQQQDPLLGINADEDPLLLEA